MTKYVATIKFEPIHQDTLTLLDMQYVLNGKNPVAAYGRLLSATLVAAAMLGLSREQMDEQLDSMFDAAHRAVNESTHIFGKGPAPDEDLSDVEKLQ